MLKRKERGYESDKPSSSFDENQNKQKKSSANLQTKFN